jgi:uncharacterized protein (TIGR02147 family)
MSIFEYSDYRSYLRHRFSLFPKKGRGKSLELARFLGTHPTVVSQIFSGLREFSEEQAIEVCDFLDLTPIEAEYFTLLVRLANAGSIKLRRKLKNEIEESKRESKSTATRVRAEKSLTDTERAVFYSSWLYSGCRLYCSTTEGGRSLEDISARFDISRTKAAGIMDFLIRTGLSVLDGEKYKMGPQSTFVDKDSPFLPKHLTNWRIKALQTVDSLSDDDLMFSGPFSISNSDLASLREKLIEVIKEFSKVAQNSAAEEVACLNIDLFRIGK